MNIINSYPINQWSIDQTSHVVTDQATDQKKKSSSSPGITWDEIPNEIKQIILHKLTPKIGRPKSKVIPSGLVNFASTSHLSKDLAIQAKREWVSQEAVSLKTFGCKTAAEAINYVIAYRLLSANLLDYPDVTDDDLNRLVENRPNLENLFIKSDYIKFFNLSHLKNLTSLDISISERCRELLKEMEKIPDKVHGLHYSKQINCAREHRITRVDLIKGLGKFSCLQSLALSELGIGDPLAAAIGKLKSLQSLTLKFCSNISPQQLADTLQNLADANLEKLDLFGCSLFNGQALAEGLQHLSKLRILDLGLCTKIPWNKLKRVLRNLTKLRKLHLDHCCQIPWKELQPILKKMPFLETKITKVTLKKSVALNSANKGVRPRTSKYV